VEFVLVFYDNRTDNTPTKQYQPTNQPTSRPTNQSTPSTCTNDTRTNNNPNSLHNRIPEKGKIFSSSHPSPHQRPPNQPISTNEPTNQCQSIIRSQARGNGSFIKPDHRIPEKGKIYSFNEANYFDWDPKLQDFVNNLKKASIDI
jgi:hypothetical protein